MPVFDPLTLGTLLTLAAVQKPAAQPQNACPFVKTVQINVTPATSDVKIDSSKTLQQLQSTEADTINPYGFSGVTAIHGFMNGMVSIQPDVRIATRYEPKIGAFCVWYDTINVSLSIVPNIVIAKEIYSDPCLRKETMNHEMKHVNVDRQIVNKYAKIIGQKIYAAIEERGFRAQPVPEEYTEEMRKRMGKVIVQVIELEHQKMQLERREAQGQVDSLAEYERVSATCPQSRAKLEQWASSKSKPRSR
jgi:hypothetical protein